MRELLLFVMGAAAGVISGMGMGGRHAAHTCANAADGHPPEAGPGGQHAVLPARRSRCAVYTQKEGRLELKSSLPVIAAGIVGALAGALAAGWLKEEWLKKAFGLFLTILSIIQYIGRSPKGRV